MGVDIAKLNNLFADYYNSGEFVTNDLKNNLKKALGALFDSSWLVSVNIWSVNFCVGTSIICAISTLLVVPNSSQENEPVILKVSKFLIGVPSG